MNILESGQNGEPSRLAALQEYRILDARLKRAYDDITELAAHIGATTMSAIWLEEEGRFWFHAEMTANKKSFQAFKALCSRAMLSSSPLVIRDFRTDRRFARSGNTGAAAQCRFFAGFPLIASESAPIGTLCVMGRRPQQLSAKQTRAMQALARRVVTLIELRRVSAHLADALEHVKTLRGLIPICAWCKRIREDDGYWSQLEAYFHAHAAADFTHSICPKCLENERTRLQSFYPKNGK